MGNELAVSRYDETEKIAKAMVASGFFKDTAQVAQAMVKIMAGQELGFGAFASMNGLYIIQGRVSISAGLMATAVKASTKYDYKVIETSEKRCEIAFYENGKDVGHSVFTIEEAIKAGTQNRDKFPKNMLFARAMSNGVRWYCPDVFKVGSVYTPEELGATVNIDGQVIDATIHDIDQKQPRVNMTEQVLTEQLPQLTEQPEQDNPLTKAWSAWYILVEKAEEAGIKDITLPLDDADIDTLRAAYKALNARLPK